VSSSLPPSLPPSLTSDLPTGVMLIAEEVTIRCRFSPGCPSSLPLSLYISALHFPRTPSLLIITQKYLISDGLCLSLHNGVGVADPHWHAHEGQQEEPGCSVSPKAHKGKPAFICHFSCRQR
jgi:hypothetical protein